MTRNQKIVIALGVGLLMANKVLGFAVKPGVILPLTPEMKYAEGIVAQVWASRGRVATVTSGLDGTHVQNSKHYEGLAEDFRTKDVPQPLKGVMVAEVKARLGTNYWIELEYEGAENEHLHVEFDPE